MTTAGGHVANLNMLVRRPGSARPSERDLQGPCRSRTTIKRRLRLTRAPAGRNRRRAQPRRSLHFCKDVRRRAIDHPKTRRGPRSSMRRKPRSPSRSAKSQVAPSTRRQGRCPGSNVYSLWLAGASRQPSGSSPDLSKSTGGMTPQASAPATSQRPDLAKWLVLAHVARSFGPTSMPPSCSRIPSEPPGCVAGRPVAELNVGANPPRRRCPVALCALRGAARGHPVAPDARAWSASWLDNPCRGDHRIDLRALANQVWPAQTRGHGIEVVRDGSRNDKGDALLGAADATPPT